jgi:UDP-glucose 4-epimerase
MAQSKEKINIFNLGTDEYCEVNDSIGWICDYLQVKPQRKYSGGSRGWIGDNPFIFLDCSKIRQLGWRPQLTIQTGILQTIQYLSAHSWVLEQRA